MMKDLNDAVRAATVTKVQPSENVQEDNSDDVSGDNDNQPLLKADASQIEQQSAPKERATAVQHPLRSWKRIRALGYIGFAAFNFSIMSVCVKYASRHVTSHETVFWRTSIAWLLNFIMLKLKHVDLTVESKYHKILAFRCFIGMVGISLQFYAMQRMVLTDAVVIIFTSPVLTFLLGALVLGEAVERIDFLSGVFAYCGVIFVARPAFLFPTHATAKDATALAVLCAMGGAFTQACAYICMRKLHDVNYMVIIHYFLLFGICFSLLTLLFFNVSLKLHLAGEVMLALFGSGLFAFVGQIFLTKGFQQEKAGIASVMRYFDVLFVLLWDTTILGEVVSSYSLFGGAIILVGAAMIVTLEHGSEGWVGDNKVDLRVEPVLRNLLFFRCIVGIICISFIFYAVSQMVLTDAVVIIFMSPVITFILAKCLAAGEPIGRIDFACALLSYVGVFFVARPAFPFGHDEDAKSTKASTFVVTCAFGTAFVQACAYITTRKLHMLHYFSLFGIFFSLATIVVFNVTLEFPTQVGVLLAVVANAAVSCVDSVFLTKGFGQESIGSASVMRYFDVLFVFVWNTTLLVERVSGYNIFGGLVLIASAVSIGVRCARSKK